MHLLHSQGLLLAACVTLVAAQQPGGKELENDPDYLEDKRRLGLSQQHSAKFGPWGEVAMQNRRETIQEGLRQKHELRQSRTLPIFRPWMDRANAAYRQRIDNGMDMANRAHKSIRAKNYAKEDQLLKQKHDARLHGITHMPGETLSGKRERQMQEYSNEQQEPFGKGEKEQGRRMLQLAHQDSIKEMRQRHESETFEATPSEVKATMRGWGLEGFWKGKQAQRHGQEEAFKRGQHEQELLTYDKLGPQALTLKRQQQMHLGSRNPVDFQDDDARHQRVVVQP